MKTIHKRISHADLRPHLKDGMSILFGGFMGVGKKNFTTRPIWSSPLLASNRVIVAGQTGELVAMNARTGEVEKTVNLGGPTLIGPIAANGTIYVVTDEAQLIALR